MGQFLSCRERVCPKCGGWLEGFEENDEWVCDVCANFDDNDTLIDSADHIGDATNMIPKKP